MSEDEVMCLLGSIVVAALTWIALLVNLARRAGLYRTWGMCLALVAAALASILMLLGLLMAFASSDVRHAPRYLVMYTALGAAWVGTLRIVLGATVGVRARDDVGERGNAAALLVQIGLIVGTTLAYTGGNFGDGPGWWVVVASAALSTAALVGVWYLVEAMGRLSHLITIDRDLATGVRAGAMLVACGAIFGRAVAGTWLGIENLFFDFFRLAWPAALIVVAEIVSQLLLKPTPETPRPSLFVAGFPPALMYLAIAGGAIYLMGWWT